MASIHVVALRAGLLTSAGRRTLSRAVAAFPLIAAGVLHADDASGKRRSRRHRPGQVAAEKKKKKKALCLNGQTVMATKKKRKKLLKQGATLGACQQTCVADSRAVTCAEQCGQVVNNCGTPVDCGPCSCQPSPWAYRAQLGTGTSGSGNTQFRGPYNVALSADGLTAWVSDSTNHRIVVWTRPDIASAAWAYNTKFGSSGSGEGQFAGPGGVAVSGDGRTAWIADTSNNRVMVWMRSTPTGSDWAFNAQIGSGTAGSGDTEFTFPSGIAVTPDGLTAWVADTGNDRIVVWKRSGPSSTTWTYNTQFGSTGTGTSNLDGPYGVAVTDTGRKVWVADSFNNRIMIWTRPDANSSDWSFEVQLGTGISGSGNNQFATPYGVAVSEDGLTAFVADAGNARVAIWKRTDTNSTDWAFDRQLGSGVPGSGNAQFDAPYGVAVSADGLVAAVADPNTYRVPIWAEVTCNT